jgi:non-specific serine/threonine protein kinase/serine/threonine-protein kinase
LSARDHPSSIAGYRILGVLGVGGMGTVYSAEQESPKRTVALKVIRWEVASDDVLRRFAREAEALGRLQHPGIARIYAAGTANGVPYFVMELVRGKPLTEYARTECRDLAARLELFARVCDAVQYAHQQGVIHRDLKPANILVDETGQPKILDFGVARLTEGENPGTLKTDVGVVVGTLQYMSPEQVGGDPLEIDTRSDIYALGVILYELLAEHLPYSWQAGGIAKAAQTIMLTEPESLGSINRHYRGDIETIAAKALEKEKARRYASAAALASDIRHYLRDEPISARPVSAAYQLRKLMRRHRGVVVGLAVAAVALVAGTVVSAAMAVRANGASHLAETRRGEAVAAQRLADQRREEAERGRNAADAARRSADSAREDAVRQRAAAIASSRRATTEAEKAFATSTFLQNMLESTNPEVTEGRNVTIKEVVDRAGRGLAAGGLANQPTVRADMYVTLGRTYGAVAAYDSALVYFDSAHAIRARTLGPLHPTTVDALLMGGEMLNYKRDLPAAERRFRTALDAARRIQPLHVDLVVDAMRRLALILELMQREGSADSLGSAAVDLARKSHASDSATIYAVQTLAEIRTFSRRAREAEPLWREVVSFNRRKYGDSSSTTLTVVYGLANNLFSQGRWLETDSLLRPILPAMRAVYGAQHPTIASVLDRLGMSLVRLGRRDEGVPYLRESLAMRLKILGENHPDVQLVRTNLGRAFQEDRQFAAAESLYTAALAARSAMFGTQNGAVASSTDDLGNLALARGNYLDAVRYYRSAISIWRTAKLPQFEVVTQSSLGEALSRADSLDEGERLLSDALTKQRPASANLSNDAVRTATRLADAWIRQGGDRLRQADSLRVWLAATLCTSGRIEQGERIAREVESTGRPVDSVALKTCERR